MAFEKFIRTKLTNRTEPIVSLSTSHFTFNSVAAGMIGLESNMRLIYHIDSENRKIGFEMDLRKICQKLYLIIFFPLIFIYPVYSNEGGYRL